MAFQTQTKFTRALLRAIQKMKQYGVCCEYGVHEPELFGQTVNADNRIEQRYNVYVLFDDSFRRRDGGTFIPTNEVTAYMASQPFKPKPGDWIVDPLGKRYPVDDVEIVKPDGFPIFYELRLIDG